MSLQPNLDTYALSMGIEIDDDGAVIPSSVIVVPSLVSVSYRLTYDQVDEMLDEGVGYEEEWQLGALLAAADKRRAFRMRKGSAEAMVPSQIPRSSVSTHANEDAPDGLGISIRIEETRFAGESSTEGVESDGKSFPDTETVYQTSSNLLVTEMMILAGEAMGRWQQEQVAAQAEGRRIANHLRLPFRGQPAPGTPETFSRVQRLAHNSHA